MDALTGGSTAAQSAAVPRRPIRLALLLDGLVQPAWIAEVLDRVAAERTVTLVGTGTRDESSVSPAQPSSLAYSAYRSLDVRRYGRPDDLTRLVDLAPHLGDLRTIDIPGHFVIGRWAPDAIGTERLRAFGADVVWYLGTAPIVEPTPVVARLGVWTLDPVHGADGARAVSNGATTTMTTLRRVHDSGSEGETIAVARTSTKAVSVAMNQAEHVRHVAAMFEGAIGRAYRGSPVGLAPSDPVVEEPEVQAVLGPGSVARMAVRIAVHLVSSKWRDTRTPRRWLLGYHFEDVDPTGGKPDAGVPATDPRRFAELAPPSDRYWADPFPVAWEGRHYLFYEEHLDGVRDAHLSVAEIEPSRGLIHPRIVLQRPYHLSFPSVFRWEGAWYMTPETSTERTVQLYRAERFPDEWTYVGDLLSGQRFVDPVIAPIDQRWWMFVGVLPPEAMEATVLLVYHADSPVGPWIPHALNPVTVDVHAARPAGRVFERGGRYYRPVQDGAPHYGHAMAIHRIDVLTPTAFRETPVERIEPNWDPGIVGTHTLNAAGRLTVLDVMRRVARPARR